MRLSVNKKLLLVVVPALIALLYFASLQVLQARQTAAAAKTVQSFVTLSAINSRLVHELQKERGASAGFLGSKGAKFGSLLEEQYGLTDSRLNDFHAYLQDHRAMLSTYPPIATIANDVETKLKRLADIRRGVQQLSIPVGDAISYYTQMNASLLSVPGEAVHISKESDISMSLAAYYDFLQAKERAGIERAVLSNSFAAKGFGPGMYKRFIELVTEQDTYFRSFGVYATQEHKEAYESTLTEPASVSVNNYRESAFANDLQKNSEQWFAESTKRINLLKGVEDQLTDDLTSLTSDIVSSRSLSFWSYLLLSVVILLFCIGFSLRITRSLNKQVQSLRQVMSVAAKKDLTRKAVVVTQDELGDIASSLNMMLAELTSAIEVIFNSSNQLATASEESTLTVNENANILESQQAHILQIVSAIEQMSASVQEVASNIHRASEAAADADRLVKNSSQ
ncbi:MAG: methyl-accepting chemotaxis protein, partial [Pseudomonas neustonica]